MLIYDSTDSIDPFISIAIPTYKRPELLKKAISSALDQDFTRAYEVVVIDNDQPISEDEVLRICKSFKTNKLRLFRNQTNIGMVGNWNQCIAHSRGEYLSILNDDDQLNGNFLSTLVPHFDADQMIIGESSINNIGVKSSVPHRPNPRIFNLGFTDFFQGNPIFGSLGMILSKAAAAKISGYDSKYYPSFDYEFSSRYAKTYGAKKVCIQIATYGWGVNESKNTTTINGFFEKDKEIRLKLIEDCITSKSMAKIANAAIRYIIGYNAKCAIKNFVPDFDESQVFKTLKPYKLPKVVYALSYKPATGIFRLLFKRVRFPL